MMFNLIGILVFNLFSTIPKTSYINKVEYIVTTKLTFNEFEGEYTMYFDEDESYFYNYSLVNEPRQDINDGPTSVIYRANDKDGFPIYKNLNTKVINYKYHVQFGKNKCIITDVLPKIRWKITKEIKKINGIDALQAFGLHDGRTYEVWFAPSIAAGHGPFHLSGLPGLILEAKTLDGKLDVKCKALQLNTTDNFVITPLTTKFKILTLAYDEFVIKKKYVLEKFMIKCKTEGTDYTPLSPDVDWQIRKGYF